MDLEMFDNGSLGVLVPITGTDPRRGPWEHRAFRPDPLPDASPVLSSATHLAVADARAALAGLDSTARRLPNPTLLRNPTLRTEAQSTSALEGTYAPLADVLTADPDEPGTPDMREILNYVRMANHGFAWVEEERPVTLSLLCDLQGMLMRGTALEGSSGRVRDRIVVIGRRADAQVGELPVRNARFVPPPPGPELLADLQALSDWLRRDHSGVIDPVVVAALGHYQFETLHPFHDGNGRLGRLLIVLQLFAAGVLDEPTLTVSPWFEARRGDYYDALLGVSTRGDWDQFIRFFARGLQESAERTHQQMLDLVEVQAQLKDVVRRSPMRAESAQALVDLAVSGLSFTVRRVQSELGVSYGRANGLVAQFVELGILQERDPGRQPRRFFSPRVVDVLLQGR